MSINHFLFFKEESLTYPDAIIYQFNFNLDYPIALADYGVHDLQLDVDWQMDDVESILKDFEQLKVLSLKPNIKMSQVIENLYGQKLYFNQILTKYFDIDLMALKDKSMEIPYFDFRLTHRKLRINSLTSFLPEFILDFGEGIEDNLVSFYVGDVGVLSSISVENYNPKYDLNRLCSAYMILEHLEYALEKFDPKVIMKNFKAHFNEIIPQNFEQNIESHQIIEGDLKGVDEFRTLIKKHRASLPKKVTKDIFDLYDSSIFRLKGVEKCFTLHTKHYNIELIDKERYARIFTYVADEYFMLCDLGSYDEANVWCDLLWSDVTCVEVDSQSYDWEFRIYLGYGGF